MKRLLALIFGLTLLLLPISGVFAQGPDYSSDNLPEQAGVYNVAGRPDLKLRVFIHNPRPPASVSAPVCGLEDPDSAAVVTSAGWHLASGTWTYRLNPSSVPASVGGANLPTIATNAFAAWSGTAVGTKVSFVAGPATTVSRAQFDSQNIVTWGRAPGTALAVSYIWYNTTTHQAVEVDTVMNKKFPWSWSGSATCADPKSYDAQNILTHEFGHTVGLDDEYATDFVNNTMYGYGAKGEAKKNTLTSGDISGVAAIY